MSTLVDMSRHLGYNSGMKECACSAYPLDKICKSLKAIAEANRLKILCLLKSGEKCVCEITESLDIPHNLILHHIKQMKKTGLICTRKKGRYTFYRIDKKALAGQLEILYKTLG
jgi:ArsR family transcriptional regulator, arsenate/arsenite/antimonite-responsive transcriptional repressor